MHGPRPRGQHQRRGYDALDRAVRVWLPGGLATVETSYDAGSRTVTDPNGKEVRTRYDAYRRAVEVERSLSGQPVLTQSTYDTLGRLVGMQDAVGNQWGWSYESLGRLRVDRRRSSSPHPPRAFGDDYEITNGQITEYVSVEGLGVVAKRVGSGPGAVTTWLHRDRLGSIVSQTDGTGAVSSWRTYRPYGETLAQGGGSKSRGWIDQRNDPETSLTYLHARCYDPQIAVFLSADQLHPARPASRLRDASAPKRRRRAPRAKAPRTNPCRDDGDLHEGDAHRPRPRREQSPPTRAGVQ